MKVGYDRGSIRNNFEEMGDDSEDEGEMDRRRARPGPGAYKTMTSDFGSSENLAVRRPETIQVFGSTVSRFREKPLGCDLGPG